MNALTANDLKTRGVAAIEALLAGQPEGMISVRGKDRYVVMEMAHYHYLRECELEAALAQTRADLAAGRFIQESAQAHVARVTGKPAKAAVTKSAVTKSGAAGSSTGKYAKKRVP